MSSTMLGGWRQQPSLGPTALVRRSAEAGILLACARTRFTAAEDERLASLLRRPINWTLLLAAAAPQGILGLLTAGLKRAPAGSVPGPMLEHLRRDSALRARRDLGLVARLLRLHEMFQAAGVRAIPLKGPVLAASLYGDITLRPVGDLDFLVAASEVPRVRELLLAQGYRPSLTHSGWEYHFSDEYGVTVDLHEKIAPEYFPPTPQFDELWERLETVPVLGSRLPALAAEDLFWLLAIQIAKDCREWKQRLIQICDVAALVQARADLNWEVLVHQSSQVGGRRILQFALRLANTLLGADLPAGAAQLAGSDSAVNRLAGHVTARLFPELTGPLAAIRYRTDIWYQDSRFYLSLRERLRDKLSYLVYYFRTQLQLWLAPSPRDRSFVSLPPALNFGYVLVRPLRVAWQRLRGARGDLPPPSTGSRNSSGAGR